MIRIHCDRCDKIILDDLFRDNVKIQEEINGKEYEINFGLRGTIYEKIDENYPHKYIHFIFCRKCLSELAIKYSHLILPKYPLNRSESIRAIKEADKNNLIGELWDIVNTYRTTSEEEYSNIMEDLFEEFLTSMKNYDEEIYRKVVKK